MRSMHYTGAVALVVAAAHSRVIQPGEVVDFDERIQAHGGGAPYSLETALMGDAERFEPVPAAPVQESLELAPDAADESQDGSEAPEVEESAPRGRKSGRRRS